MIRSRNVWVQGSRTSITLEDVFWDRLCDIAHRQETTVDAIVSDIKSGLGNGNLSSAVRVFVACHNMSDTTQIAS